MIIDWIGAPFLSPEQEAFVSNGSSAVVVYDDAINVIVAGVDVSARIYDGHTNPVTWSLSKGFRGTASVELICLPLDAFAPEEGQPVFIYTSGVCRFAGTIDTLPITYIGVNGNRYWSLECVSLEQCFDTLQVFPPRSYFGQTAGSIFIDLAFGLCAGAPVIAGPISAGPVIDALVLLTDRVTDVFNYLCTQAGFIWGVDPEDQSIYFHAQNSRPAPFILENDDVLWETLTYKQTRQDFRDRQVTRVAADALPITPSVVYESVSSGNPVVLLNLPNLIDAVVNAVLTTSTVTQAHATFTGIPADGDTITIGSAATVVAYTFKTTIDNREPRQVLIAATAGGNAANLVDAVNANFDTIGTAFSFPSLENEYMRAALEAAGSPPTLTGIVLSAKVLGTAGNGISLTTTSAAITLVTTGAPFGGYTFTLASDNGFAVVPASVTVTISNTSANFTITTTDPAPDVVQATITATDPNGVPLSATLTINPAGFSAATIASLGISPNPVTGGAGNPTGTVTLSAPAGGGGVLVNLASSNSVAASVPLAVTVTAGLTTANFTITTTHVAAATDVTITATSSNVVTQTLTINAAAASSVVHLAIAPSSVAGGQSATGTITIFAVIFVGTVTLTSTDARVVVPASVNYNNAPATFAISTTASETDITVTIIATTSGETAYAAITVTGTGSGGAPGSGLASSLTFAPNPVTGGSSVTATINLANAGGGTDGTSTALTVGTGPAGSSDVTYVRGQGSLAFYYTPSIPASTFLYVTYRRLGGDCIVCENTTVVQARAVVEQGTGKYQQTVTNTGITQVAAGLASSQQTLEAFGGFPSSIRFDTYRAGLSAGQYLTVSMTLPVTAGALIDGFWLIQQIDAVMVPGMRAAQLIRYSVTAISVPQMATWISFWEALASGGSSTGLLGAGNTTTLISGGGGGGGGGITLPIAQSDVTGLVTDLAAKAPLASPALTGNPTAPTQTSGNNSTRLATTAFVQTEIAPKAPLASPALTGVPTAPTAAAATNTTQLATTAFVEGEFGIGQIGDYFPWGGDGSDGSVTFDGAATILGLAPSSSIYTLVRDIFCINITVNSGVTIKTANYAIFATGTVTVTGTIHNDGQVGSNGNSPSSATGGSGGGAGVRTSNPGGNDGHYSRLIAGVAGTNGANGGTGAGSQAGVANVGTSVLGSPMDQNGAAGATGSSGGKGGTGTGGAGGAARTGGTAGAAFAAANWQIGRNPTIATFGKAYTGATVQNVQASNAGNGGAAGGSGGGGDTTNAGGGGGGGGGEGGSAGVVGIFAHAIVVAAAGIIRANGGTGGNGGNGRTQTVGNVGGGGGGAGGSGGVGGIVWLVYHTLANAGTVQALGGTHGSGGTKGNPNGSGTNDAANGSDGSDGPAGNVVTIRA